MECWNIDKFEGAGNGPCVLPEADYAIVRDYLGNHNPALPGEYFDLVFSLSALEHVPEEEDLFAGIMSDIDRVLKPGGYSVHLLDIVRSAEGQYWMNGFTRYMFAHASTLNSFVAPEDFPWREDIYYMSEKSYRDIWERITRRSYRDFGRPASLAVFWKKPGRH
jgi:SAM-dependent methyltransferase